ncbi:GNAT family N-acetyltransferase [Deinococcus cellulosilyticus]|uniref:N-acetyltransferase n=1 Tax=Deinococcus cellulosilyticus (strain DSM 18568 / NBRC 106333 / KACC 11606 / 5516J-15) TaxID=1223518 RepID=A0A511N8N1_DEIC1|nr:GNAT family protein [Deinococcus cellulosilyticus]GEM49213.1 N-acetyltransferase [Deinococcus cellulosilyticus NBRC 106333 = KACC 11606]
MIDLSMFDAFPILQTERLVLRDIRETDISDVFQLFSNPEVTRFHGTSTFMEEKQAAEFVNFVQSRYREKTGIRWAITLRDTGAFIGTVGMNSIIQHRTVIGYDLSEAHWGRGYMPEAVQAMLEYAFSVGLYRVQAMVIPGNQASVRVLEKLGFREEGLLRSWYHWEGRYWDMLSFSLLKPEFRPESRRFSGVQH